MTDWKSALRFDPTPWLLENACAPIKYRVLTELLDRPKEDPDVQKLRAELMLYPPALKLQRTQRKDGTWAGHVHAGDAKRFEPSLENDLSLLYEMGWGRDTKPVKQAAAILRSFLTAKKDLKFYEFAKVVKADEKREKYYRWFLRTLGLGLLVRGGYVDDRSRVAVLELLDLCAGFVDDPVSRHPVEEIGAAHPLIRSGAWKRDYIFIPDVQLMRVFAFSPWLLDGELAKMRLKKISDYVMSDTYQKLAPDIGLVRTAKGSFVKGGGLRIRPIDYYQKHAALDELLVNMEFFARLGLLNRYPHFMTHLEWWHAQQGKEGRWNLQGKLLNETSRWTALLRLEKDWRSPVRKEADLTFRVLLILKYQWERQIRMLDRRDDGYTI
ncbi:MAG TPA: hypothetical protein VFV19_14330 [Candidatus Polarisedimenticolaceae bacterium]|nr:hypothetical protein [Candidatus Polarisedimenticolaceae bacterium]